MSIHAAKGKEADYAILTGMTQGQHGFPASKVNLTFIGSAVAS
ncbi:hypothetical protein P4S73_04005 [Paraglaciecola sp. Hal342]